LTRLFGAARRVAESAASVKLRRICREQDESRYSNEATNSSGSHPVRVLIQALRERQGSVNVFSSQSLCSGNRRVGNSQSASVLARVRRGVHVCMLSSLQVHSAKGNLLPSWSDDGRLTVSEWRCANGGIRDTHRRATRGRGGHVRAPHRHVTRRRGGYDRRGLGRPLLQRRVLSPAERYSAAVGDTGQVVRALGRRTARLRDSWLARGDDGPVRRSKL
jgi:hypothetical protein